MNDQQKFYRISLDIALGGPLLAQMRHEIDRGNAQLRPDRNAIAIANGEAVHRLIAAEYAAAIVTSSRNDDACPWTPALEENLTTGVGYSLGAGSEGKGLTMRVIEHDGKFDPLNALRSVLCNIKGEASFEGSDGDRAVVDKALAALDPAATAIPAGLLEALRTIDRTLNLGDQVYKVRDGVDMSDRPAGESSWEHPDVVAYSEAVAVVKKAVAP